MLFSVLHAKNEKVCPAYYSKQNLKCETQSVILWMIPNIEVWHYLALKKLLALLRGTPSKNDGDFYCLNCLHSFRTKSKLESHKKFWK